MKSRDLYLRLLHYVLPYRARFALALLGTVVLAATEPAMPALMKLLLDETFVARSETGLVLLPVLLVLLFVVRGMATFTGNVGMQWVATRVVTDLRREMFDRLLTLPAWYFDNHASGNIIAKYTFNVQRVTEAATSVLVTLVKDSLIVAGLLAWTLYINWRLSLFVLAIAPPTALIIRYVSRRLRTLGRSLQDTVGDLTRVIQESINGNRDIKIFGGANRERGRFAELNERVRRYHMQATTVSEANVPVVQVLTVIALAVVIYIASVQSHTGELTVGEFVSLIGALALMSSPIKRLTKVNTHLQAGLAAAESVFALVDGHPEENTGRMRIDRAAGRIEFRNVAYTHHNSRRAALHDVSLEIAAGETVALVGPSGSGKSTLANLIPRFYTPTAGSVRLDGTDLRDIELDSLRSQIAWVGQQVILFNDSIAANIGYGAPHGASPAEIAGAAQRAHAMEFVEPLPDGLDTLVGENGIRLSAGQRQRIAIARALIKDSPILILDEATSALDSRSERMVQEALAELRQGRTSLIIAHRLSTIRDADRIIVLQGGRIVETGTHAALLAMDGTYARLYRLQQARGTQDIDRQAAESIRGTAPE